MTAVRAVCFDLDGTLFDHRGAARAGAAEFLAGLGVTATESALAAWSAAEDAQFERWRSGRISFRDQRRERLRVVLPPLGLAVPEEDAALDALFDRYLHAYRAAWRAFPDSGPLLAGLRARGYRLGLLTNGAADQQLEKLARTGLDGTFDAVCVSEAIGFQKPDPRAFRRLADELGVEPTACLFVGDDAERDVAGARSAGMQTALVDRYGDEPVGAAAAVEAVVGAGPAGR